MLPSAIIISRLLLLSNLEGINKGGRGGGGGNENEGTGSPARCTPDPPIGFGGLSASTGPSDADDSPLKHFPCSVC